MHSSHGIVPKIRPGVNHFAAQVKVPSSQVHQLTVLVQGVNPLVFPPLPEILR